VRRTRQVAVLIVEHDLDLVGSVAERAYVLDSGRNLAEGSVADVLHDASVRAAYLGEGT